MKINNDLDEKGECRKKRENGEILFELGSNSVITFESLLTGVVAGLECCDRRWLFLGKEERSKNEELNMTGICNRRMTRKGIRKTNAHRLDLLKAVRNLSSVFVVYKEKCISLEISSRLNAKG